MRRRVAIVGAFLALATAVGVGGAGCTLPRVARPQDLTPAVDRVEARINAALLRQGVTLAEVRTGFRQEVRRDRSLNARWPHRSYTIVAYPTFRNLQASDYAAAVREGAGAAGARVSEVRQPGAAADRPVTFRLMVQLPVRVGGRRASLAALDLSIVPPAAGSGGGSDHGRGPGRREREPQPKGPTQIALIIDDWGYEQPLARDFFSLPVPLTMAVLPGLPASERLAREGHDRGWEVLVHLPMQPEAARLARPGDLTVTMSDEELRQRVREALAGVPFAEGVNNHQGSRATRERRVMEAVLSEVAAHGLFFVDSRTSPASVAAEVARELSLAYGENLLFLDGRPEPGYIREMLHTLVEAAERNGYAIGIAHVRPVTLAVLQERLPALIRQGVVFVPVRQVVRPDFRYRWQPAVRPPVPAPVRPSAPPSPRPPAPRPAPVPAPPPQPLPPPVQSRPEPPAEEPPAQPPAEEPPAEPPDQTPAQPPPEPPAPSPAVQEANS